MKVHKRISLVDGGDKFREALVMGPGDGQGSVTLDVESLRLRFNVSLTPAQAHDLGLALIEAAGVGGEKASG